MTTERIIRRACERGILPWRPAFRTMTMILMDDDGLVVATTATHEVLTSSVIDASDLAAEVVRKMMDERGRLRS
jgi:hypothetical protein